MASTDTRPAGRLDDIPQREIDSGPLDVSALVGTWLNTDRGDSGGVHKLVVRESDESDVLAVHGYGVGDPDPFDWSEVTAPAFAFSVEGGTAWGFTCEYDFEFLRTEIAAYGKEGILIIVTYNSFRDRSGRSDYWTREFFHREDA